MALEDFEAMTPDEFGAITEAWSDETEKQDRAEWERMRLLATITIQPHVKGKVKPEKLIQFPWEKPKTVRGKAMSLEERQRLMEQLAKK